MRFKVMSLFFAFTFQEDVEMKDYTSSQDDDESEDEGLEEVVHQQEENY